MTERAKNRVLKVTWYDEPNDAEAEVVGTKGVTRPWNDDELLDAVQAVVDAWEQGRRPGGMTIDQGGDDDYYEFNVADSDDWPNIVPNATRLLAELEAALP